MFFSACGNGDEPDRTNHGYVTLTPKTATLKYGETIRLTPAFSETGKAKDKTYSWRNDGSGVLSHKILTGNIAEVTASRIGEGHVIIYSTDGKISASSTIYVESRTNFLSHIYFEAGVNMADVKNRAQGTLNTEETTDKKLVYDIAENSKIKQEIYYFHEGKLYSTIVILNDTEEVRTETEKFIEERFIDMNLSTTEGIKYYDASVFKGYAKGVVVGMFLPSGTLNPENISGKLGVKFTTQLNLMK